LAVGGLTFWGDGGAEAAPEEDIEAMLAGVEAAWNARDVETLLTYLTDDGVEFVFGAPRGEARAFIPDDMTDLGDIVSLTVSDIFVTSGNARGIVEVTFESDEFILHELWRFQFVDGGWRIDNGESVQRKSLPQGVTPVTLDLYEYAFVFDAAATKSGNFAFQVSNRGREEHEAVIFRLTSDAPLSKLIAVNAGEVEGQEGMEFVAFGGFYEAGTEGTALFPKPFEPGRYGLFCFVQSAVGQSHAALGMASEFTVTGSGGGGIIPPSTGNAGLKSRD
jgi:hypothetical protein